ncbi:hypothetical protein ACU4GH_22580 [Bradyrhizobium betae]
MTDDLKKRLNEIADTVNRFKSEAVQLRVIDALLGSLSGGAPHEQDGEPQLRTARRRARKAKPRAAEPEKDKKKKQGSRNSGSPGAWATIVDLEKSGFFKTPRTIAAIIAHAGTQRGHHYKANECSGPLLRLLRDGKLKRAKNKDGQYEYVAA